MPKNFKAIDPPDAKLPAFSKVRRKRRSLLHPPSISQGGVKCQQRADRLLTQVLERLAANDISQLTAKEKTAVVLMARGLCDCDIAEQLKVAQSTAHGYVEIARKKLGAASRDEAAAIIKRLGLLGTKSTKDRAV